MKNKSIYSFIYLVDYASTSTEVTKSKSMSTTVGLFLTAVYLTMFISRSASSRILRDSVPEEDSVLDMASLYSASFSAWYFLICASASTAACLIRASRSERAVSMTDLACSSASSSFLTVCTRLSLILF